MPAAFATRVTTRFATVLATSVARSSARRLVSHAPATVLYMAKIRWSAYIRRLASDA